MKRQPALNCEECRHPLPEKHNHPSLCPECVWSLVRAFGGNGEDEYPDLSDVDDDCDWDD